MEKIAAAAWGPLIKILTPAKEPVFVPNRTEQPELVGSLQEGDELSCPPQRLLSLCLCV